MAAQGIIMECDAFETHSGRKRRRDWKKTIKFSDGQSLVAKLGDPLGEREQVAGWSLVQVGGRDGKRVRDQASCIPAMPTAAWHVAHWYDAVEQ